MSLTITLPATPLRIVAAMIQHPEQFISGRRWPLPQFSAGLWSPLCTQVHDGESEKAAVVRECFDEVGLIVKPLRKLAEFYSRTNKLTINWWTVAIMSGTAETIDGHSPNSWFTLEELRIVEAVHHLLAPNPTTDRTHEPAGLATH
jgi:ADP-ribose pyrophosphatase YjhB (NUDIX family)